MMIEMSTGMWVRSAVFLAGALGLILVSRASLRDPAAHGFFRLFAFITILALILVNVPFWFRDAFGPLQLVSWLLLFISIGMVAGGLSLLVSRGRPSGSFENTSVLVNTGLYRYIRHPMYSSLLFLAWGAALKQVTWLSLLLALLASVFLWLTARVEEAENLARFGEDYAFYMARTRRFVPFVF